MMMICDQILKISIYSHRQCREVRKDPETVQHISGFGLLMGFVYNMKSIE